MAQFGPAPQWPWTKLVDVPELTDELVDKVAAQSDAQAEGQSVRELERVRDDCLVALLQALRGQEYGAGATLAAWERELLSREGGVQPRAYEARVPANWIDYNGHVHESRYLQLCSDASDAFFGRLGIDAEYLATSGSYFTVETHLSHLRQLEAGDRVGVTTQVLGWDDKRLHVFHRVARDGEEDPVATAEQLFVHVDAASGRAGPVRGRVREAVAALAEAHASLPRPERAGRSIGLPART
jgi:carnitine 3-dehydrogenase